jgi:hypothetical protein
VTTVETLVLLLLGHLLADYPLQGDFLSRAKSAVNPIPGVPWWQAMSAHCGIQAGFVWLATGSVTLGALEFVVHFVTDDAKCRNRISYNADQAIHIGCKLLWLAAVVLDWS